MSRKRTVHKYTITAESKGGTDSLSGVTTVNFEIGDATRREVVRRLLIHANEVANTYRVGLLSVLDRDEAEKFKAAAEERIAAIDEGCIAEAEYAARAAKGGG